MRGTGGALGGSRNNPPTKARTTAFSPVKVSKLRLLYCIFLLTPIPHKFHPPPQLVNPDYASDRDGHVVTESKAQPPAVNANETPYDTQCWKPGLKDCAVLSFANIIST